MNLSMALAIGLLAVASAAQAQISPDAKMPVPSAASIAASKVLTHGVVQKVDSASGMVTLKHLAMKVSPSWVKNDGNFDRASCRTCVDGVGQEVCDKLFDPLRVDRQGGKIR